MVCRAVGVSHIGGDPRSRDTAGRRRGNRPGGGQEVGGAVPGGSLRQPTNRIAALQTAPASRLDRHLGRQQTPV